MSKILCSAARMAGVMLLGRPMGFDLATGMVVDSDSSSKSFTKVRQAADICGAMIV